MAHAEPVAAFHASRLMWGVWNRTLLIAARQCPLSHEKWFESLGFPPSIVDEFMRVAPRGFIKGNALYAYQGHEFQSLTPNALESFHVYIADLAKLGHLSSDAPVYCGMVPGLPGEIWQPRQQLGKVADYVNNNSVGYGV